MLLNLLNNEKLHARGIIVHVLCLGKFAKGMGNPNYLIMLIFFFRYFQPCAIISPMLIYTITHNNNNDNDNSTNRCWDGR